MTMPIARILTFVEANRWEEYSKLRELRVKDPEKRESIMVVNDKERTGEGDSVERDGTA